MLSVQEFFTFMEFFASNRDFLLISRKMFLITYTHSISGQPKMSFASKEYLAPQVNLSTKASEVPTSSTDTFFILLEFFQSPDSGCREM